MTTNMDANTIEALEQQGFQPWNDQPGDMIESLQELLAPHGLTLEVREAQQVIMMRIVKDGYE